MNKAFAALKGGATAAAGFRAAGVCCGIKPKSALDLAILYSEREAAAAGAFTTSAVRAAPVQLTSEILAGGRLRAVVVNSGSANACTGEAGMEDARAMAAEAARVLGLAPEEVGVCSTGVIGRRLAMDKIIPGIGQLGRLVAGGGNAFAARAIMTTDTRPKEFALEFQAGETPVRIGGMAKGAGMIYPKLAVAPVRHATMLALITTDAAVAAGPLRLALGEALEKSFNRITVDGDTSTNDTVILIANGASGAEITPDGPSWGLFREALETTAGELAVMIAADGEGASKLVRFEVSSAATPAEALQVARAAANSLLLKCALFGECPNWGRIMAAVGYSGAGVGPDAISVFLNGIPVIADGLLAGADPEAVRAALAEPRLDFRIDLGRGSCGDFYYTCDITPEYVEINKE